MMALDQTRRQAITARRRLVPLFALTGVLGLILIVLASAGDAIPLATTGGVYGALEARGLEGDEALVGDYSTIVLQ